MGVSNSLDDRPERSLDVASVRLSTDIPRVVFSAASLSLVVARDMSDSESKNSDPLDINTLSVFIKFSQVKYK